MPRYAVKIGEIRLRSDKPITLAERAAAIRDLKRRDWEDQATITDNGLEVELCVTK